MSWALFTIRAHKFIAPGICCLIDGRALCNLNLNQRCHGQMAAALAPPADFGQSMSVPHKALATKSN